MSLMFASLRKINTLDLSMIDTSNVSDMHSMFENSVISDLNLSTFNTSKVTDMSQMFNYATINNLNLLSFDTSNVIDMSYMFENTKNLEIIDISSFDTSNVTKMGFMFYYSSNLKTVYVGDNWSTSNVNNSARMFEGSTKLVGGAGTTYDANHTDKEYAHVDSGTSNPGYFTLKTN
jgi:surface protein